MCGAWALSSTQCCAQSFPLETLERSLLESTGLPVHYLQVGENEEYGSYLVLILSLACIDLLKIMLTIDPTQRATTKQIRDHPWIQGKEMPLPEGYQLVWCFLDRTFLFLECLLDA